MPLDLHVRTSTCPHVYTSAHTRPRLQTSRPPCPHIYTSAYTRPCIQVSKTSIPARLRVGIYASMPPHLQTSMPARLQGKSYVLRDTGGFSVHRVSRHAGRNVRG